MKRTLLKSMILLSGILLVSISCDKTETFDDRWKLDNETRFEQIAANPAYTKLNSQSGNGFIMYKELQKGDGQTPLFNNKVKVLYTGWYKNNWFEEQDSYINDKGQFVQNKIIFDSTAKRNDIPSSYYVNQLVDGFTTALQHMQVGDIWEIWIPWKLAYGDTGKGTIPGYTTLVFEIELVDIIE